MDIDPVFLSRLQFAWLIAWHILLPAFTVGLAAFIAVLEGLNFITGRQVYLRVSVFWIKIFSISFGMGVVSGIMMPFQFGTNWSRFSDITANVLSPLFAYEGLTAFFLEAAFLGVLLFGRKLVPPWAHVIAAMMVALWRVCATPVSSIPNAFLGSRRACGHAPMSRNIGRLPGPRRLRSTPGDACSPCCPPRVSTPRKPRLLPRATMIRAGRVRMDHAISMRLAIRSSCRGG